MARIPKFYKLSVTERVRAVRKQGLLSPQDFQALVSGEHTLDVDSADKMIENVIGVMGLPVGLGLNFLINGREYAVPLVVDYVAYRGHYNQIKLLYDEYNPEKVSRCGAGGREGERGERAWAAGWGPLP